MTCSVHMAGYPRFFLEIIRHTDIKFKNCPISIYLSFKSSCHMSPSSKQAHVAVSIFGV